MLVQEVMCYFKSNNCLSSSTVSAGQWEWAAGQHRSGPLYIDAEDQSAQRLHTGAQHPLNHFHACLTLSLLFKNTWENSFTCLVLDRLVTVDAVWLFWLRTAHLDSLTDMWSDSLLHVSYISSFISRFLNKNLFGFLHWRIKSKMLGDTNVLISQWRKFDRKNEILIIIWNTI